MWESSRGDIARSDGHRKGGKKGKGEGNRRANEGMQSEAVPQFFFHEGRQVFDEVVGRLLHEGKGRGQVHVFQGGMVVVLKRERERWERERWERERWGRGVRGIVGNGRPQRTRRQSRGRDRGPDRGPVQGRKETGLGDHLDGERSRGRVRSGRERRGREENRARQVESPGWPEEQRWRRGSGCWTPGVPRHAWPPR